MIEPSVVLLTAPFTDRPYVVTDPPSNPTIGRICKNLVTPKCVVPTADAVVVDFLARARFKRIGWVEHKTLGRLSPLYRRQLNNGSFALIVEHADGDRTLVIDAARWITPIEKLLQVKMKMQKVKKFYWWANSKKYQQRRIPTRKRNSDKPWSGFARCTECGTDFVNHKDVPTISEFAFCDGDCKRKWFEKHPAACELRKPVRFHHVAPEDVDWAKRQPRLNKRAVRAKCLDQFWCKTCFAHREDVHECEPALVVERYEEARREFYLKTATANHTARQITPTPRVETFDLGYPIDSCVACEAPLRKAAPKTQKQLELHLAGLGSESKGAHAHSFSEHEDGVTSPEDRGDAAYFAKRPERYVGRTLTICFRPGCGRTLAKRKGTKYCSKNCCNRHGEELKLIKENTCQQALLLEHQAVLN